MTRAERFQLANGWTVSFSEDAPPAFCSVAAWPTHYGDAPRDQSLWFDFTRSSDDPPAFRARDRRCWSLEDVVEALRLIADAPRPQVSAHAAGGLWGPDPK